MPWSVPKIWSGGDCFILGGGPSLKLSDVEMLKGRHVIAVNNAYQIAPWADFCFFMDSGWFREHRERLKDFGGIKVSIAHNVEAHGVKEMVRGKREGLSVDPKTLNHGHNSGHSAVNLAILLGAKTIVLLGFDMKVVDGKHNWHAGHARKMRTEVYEEDYLKCFATIVKPLEQLNAQVLNTVKDSALTCFPFIDLGDYLRNGGRYHEQN